MEDVLGSKDFGTSSDGYDSFVNGGEEGIYKGDPNKETIQYTLLKETGVVGKTSPSQYMPSVEHKHSLSEGIPTRREANSLYH